MPAKETTKETKKRSGSRTASKGDATTRSKTTAGSETRVSGSVELLMSRPAQHVRIGASANDAARLMWDDDIGIVPVVDEEHRLVGVVTDRDIAMAAYLQGRRLADLPLEPMMSREVHAVKASDTLSRAATVMARHQIRRVPVLDEAGTLVGMLSLNDLAGATAYPQADGLTEHDLAATLRAICAPRMVPALRESDATAQA